MSKKSTPSNDENPMAYFGIRTASLKQKNKRDIQSFENYMRLGLSDLQGFSDLKAYIDARIQMIIYNKTRAMHGLSYLATNERETIVLNGVGDRDLAIKTLASFLRRAKINTEVSPIRMNAAHMTNYWKDTVRRDVDDMIAEARSGVLVIDNLHGLLSDTDQGADYARHYLTQRLVETANDHQLVVIATQSDMQKWIAECPVARKLNHTYIACNRYTADDLTKQFVKMARKNGYAIPDYVVRKISHVFAQVQSTEFKKTNINNLASLVFNKCQMNQHQRLSVLPIDLQTPRRLRAFRKNDLVRIIVPCENEVMVA